MASATSKHLVAERSEGAHCPETTEKPQAHLVTTTVPTSVPEGAGWHRARTQGLESPTPITHPAQTGSIWNVT